jgi:hypothetical protein
MLKLIDNVPSNPIIIYNHLKGKKRKEKKSIKTKEQTLEVRTT